MPTTSPSDDHSIDFITHFSDLRDPRQDVARQPPCPVPTTTLAGFEAAGVGVFFGFLG